MKKGLYFPVLALSFALVACDGAANLKAPSFEKEGEEVSYAEFISAMEQAEMGNEISDQSFMLGDKTLKLSYSTYVLKTVKRNSKEFNKEEQTMSAKCEGQYDVDNKVAKETADGKQTYKYQSQEGNGNSTTSSKTEHIYQFGKYQGSDYLFEVNTKMQTYRNEMSGSSTSKNFDSFLRNRLRDNFTNFPNYVPYSTNEARNYLFYMNGDYKFTYTNNEEKEETFNAYKLASRLKLKGQIDYTDGKEAFRLSYEESLTYEYNSNYDEHLAGDIVTEERKLYVDCSVEAKDVSLDPVDISNYSYTSQYY